MAAGLLAKLIEAVAFACVVVKAACSVALLPPGSVVTAEYPAPGVNVTPVFLTAEAAKTTSLAAEVVKALDVMVVPVTTPVAVASRQELDAGCETRPRY